MKEILQKLFNNSGPTTTVATMVRRLSDGRYEVADDAGRIATVESDIVPLTPGKRVLLQFGRIIKLAGPAASIKIYEV